jgi:plastocyanin
MFRRHVLAASRPVALVLALLATALLAACGGSDDAQTPDASVTVTSGARTTHIERNDFESPMKVTAGSEVTWVNDDGIAHNVVGANDAFRSDTMKKGDTFVHTFDTAGSFKYTCTFHPGMNGVIEVQ